MNEKKSKKNLKKLDNYSSILNELQLFVEILDKSTILKAPFF